MAPKKIKNLSYSTLRAKRRKLFFRRGVWVLVLLLLLSIGLLVASQRPYFKLTTVRVAGNQAVSSRLLVEHIETRLRTKMLGVIGLDNYFWYPKQALRTSLLAEFRWFEDLSMSVADNELLVTFSERTPVAVWCGVTQIASEPCQFLDGDGLTFAEAVNFSGSVWLKIYGKRGEDNIVRLSESFTVLLDFIQAVNGLNFTIDAVTYDGVDYVMTLSDGAYILVSSELGLTKTFVNLETLVNQGKLLTDGKNQIEYIDLRFGNRVYIKRGE